MTAHATLSASGSEKWATCTMSAFMESDIEEEDSDFSAEGTCAHAVIERRLSEWLDPSAATGSETAVANYDKYFNLEMDGHVTDFVEYVKGRVAELRAEHGARDVQVLLEQRVVFDKWVPDGYGTCDVVILVPGKVVVIDFKYGAGIYVDVHKSKQLRIYGLGSIQTYGVLYDFEEVEIVIHQPRMDNVSSETLRVDHLLMWADEFLKPRAAIAWAAVHGDRSQACFSPGEHCNKSFCKARFVCGARARYMVELAEQPGGMGEPDVLTQDQMEDVAARAPFIAKWARDVESWLLKTANSGKVTLRKFQLTRGRSNRVLKDHEQVARLLMQQGYGADDIYGERSLRGITELERLVGKKQFAEILAEQIAKPEGAIRLAPLYDKVRAVAPKGTTADQDFS